MAAQMGVSLISVTIASGQSLSAQVDLGANVLTGIYLPSGWTAANLTFQVSPDGGTTWFEHYSYAGSETIYGLSGGAGFYVAIDPTLWKGIYSLKVRSGTVASPVVQSSSVALQLVGKLG